MDLFQPLLCPIVFLFLLPYFLIFILVFPLFFNRICSNLCSVMLYFFTYIHYVLLLFLNWTCRNRKNYKNLPSMLSILFGGSLKRAKLGQPVYEGLIKSRNCGRSLEGAGRIAKSLQSFLIINIMIFF